MHSACNHLLLYNRPFSENHQFGVSLRNSSANIWKRSVTGIHVKSKADFKKFLSLWFDIQFTQYVFSPDLTWVRQISNDFARSRVAFFRGCFVCVWHCHVCQTSSQKDHCMSFYLNAIADKWKGYSVLLSLWLQHPTKYSTFVQ